MSTRSDSMISVDGRIPLQPAPHTVDLQRQSEGYFRLDPSLGTNLVSKKRKLRKQHLSIFAVDLVGLVGFMPLGALYPSKSGLMNKHIVKHIVHAFRDALFPSKSGLMNIS